MLRLLRGAFERSAKAMKTGSRSKLLVYPGVIIGVSAAAAATWFSLEIGKDYVIKYQAFKKEEEELQLIAFRKKQLRKLRKAYYDPIYCPDDYDHPVVFPPKNGRTIYQMVRDYEEEEEKKNEEEEELRNKERRRSRVEKGFKSYVDYSESVMSSTFTWYNNLRDKLTKKFRPFAECDMIRKILMSDCGATMVEKAAEEDESLSMSDCGATKVKKTAEEDDEYLSDERLVIQAKLRGMNTAEFLVYIRQELEYCKDMCQKCTEFPLPPGCVQEDVNRFCVGDRCNY